MKNEVAVIGYYGGNFGDLLMLKSLLDTLKEKYKNVKIFTYGSEILLKKCLVSSSEIYCEVYSLKRISIFDFLKLISRASAIIWGGGTCFMDQGGTGGIKYMFLSKLLGIKVVYLGIGIDKSESFKTKFCISIANLVSDKIYFRDVESLERAKESLFYNNKIIDTIPDLGIRKFSRFDKEEYQGPNYIVFCCRDLKEYEEGSNSYSNLSLINLALRISRELSVNRIVNLICDTEVDEIEAKNAEGIFKKNNLEVINIYGNEVQMAYSAIKFSKFVLTVRLHPAVVAHCQGVPYAVFNYSDKNQKFTRTFNEEDRLITSQNLDTYSPNFDFPKQNLVLEYEEELKGKLNELYEIL